MKNEIPTMSAPWWRHGHVWMLIAGPAAVVVAGTATIVLAVRNPDPVLAPDYYRRGIEINKTLAARDAALLPAQQARNHVATPAPR
jgi:uncharacterized protein